MSASLVRYDAMCTAIAAAHAIDEVMEIHDKARALEVYAMQAKNTEAETKACEIRLRAERRAGQMIATMEKAKGAQGNPNGQGAPIVRSRDGSAQKTLKDHGISHNQSSRWQKLAAIPDDDFEKTFAKPEKKPSTTGIIAAHQQKTAPPPPEPKTIPVDERALWLWGRLLDFERQGILAADPDELFETMLDHMKETTRELAPLVAKWLGRIAA